MKEFFDIYTWKVFFAAATSFSTYVMEVDSLIKLVISIGVLIYVWRKALAKKIK